MRRYRSSSLTCVSVLSPVVVPLAAFFCRQLGTPAVAAAVLRAAGAGAGVLACAVPLGAAQRLPPAAVHRLSFAWRRPASPALPTALRSRRLWPAAGGSACCAPLAHKRSELSCQASVLSIVGAACSQSNVTVHYRLLVRRLVAVCSKGSQPAAPLEQQRPFVSLSLHSRSHDHLHLERTLMHRITLALQAPSKLVATRVVTGTN